MKSFVLFAACTALTGAGVSAQVVLQDTPVTSGAFYDLVDAMRSRGTGPSPVDALYRPQDTPSTTYTSFLWDRSEEAFITNAGGTVLTPETGDLLFTETANFSAWLLNGGAPLELGFLGNESQHRDRFGYLQTSLGGSPYFDTEKQLVQYQRTLPADGNRVYRISAVNPSGGPVERTGVGLFHQNWTLGTALRLQNDADFFKFFRAQTATDYYYMLLVEDTRIGGLIDYDDLIVLVRQPRDGSVVVIPEPSTVALLGVGLVGAAIGLRRLRRR